MSTAKSHVCIMLTMLFCVVSHAHGQAGTARFPESRSYSPGKLWLQWTPSETRGQTERSPISSGARTENVPSVPGFPRINSAWWAGASAEMRRGVINGAFDCLTRERATKLPRLPATELSSKVDTVLVQGGGDKTLADALRALSNESGPTTSGGEDYSKEKHGWFDGYYWGSASDDERYGFLAGYLSCGNVLGFSVEQVKTYRHKIDSWYERHPSSNAKIANVLGHVRQRSSKSTLPQSKK